MLKRIFIFFILTFALTFADFSSGFAENNLSISDFDGKRIAVPTGTINDEIVHEVLPSAKILYFETDADTVGAVLAGKADAYADDEEVLKAIIKTNDKLTMADGYLKNFYNAFIFTKTSRGDKLRGEFNEYFKRIKSDGTLNNINDIWLGDDENLKILSDYENLPDINGVVEISVSNESAPFVYVKDGRTAGCEADIIVHFCREKGYKPVFVPGNFSSIIPSIVSGKCEIGMGAITITEERAQSVNFSEPIYEGGTRLLTLKTSNSSNEISEVKTASFSNSKKFTEENHTKLSISDFNGKKIGVPLGTDNGQLVGKTIPSAEVVYFNNAGDILIALKNRKIDALCCSIISAKYMLRQHNDITYIPQFLHETFRSPIFPKTDKGRKLCAEYAEFITSLEDDGTLEKLFEKWTNPKGDTPPKVDDYGELPAINGTLKLASDTELEPFSYILNNKLQGYDIELAMMFCKAKGYGLEFVPMPISGILAAVKTGKCDFSVALTYTEERAKTVLFSPKFNSKTGNVLVVMKDKKPTAKKISEHHTTFKDLEKKRIGVQVGTTCAELIPEKFPSAEVSFFNSIPDALTALKTGKIDAMCCALPSAVYVANEDKNLEIVEPYLREAYLYSIFVNSDRGKKLCEEYSAFLKTLWDDGTIDELANKWLGPDESKKTVEDYTKLPATNGILKMAVDSSIVPFAYIKDNKITGHAIDLAVRFCKAKGYGLEISNMSLSAVIASVKSGKCDFTQAMTKSKERGENTLFASSPSMKSGNVILVMKNKKSEKPVSSEISKLAGKRIGVVTGSTHPQIAAEYVPTAELVYFDNAVDELTALKAGKIDAACTGIPLLRRIMAEDDSIMPYGEQLTFTEGAPIFQKSEKGEKLCAQFSEFAKKCWDDGTIKELEKFWFDQEESKCIMKDYSNLPAPNGVLKAAVNEVSPPFIYFKDNRIVGYDIEFIYKFCEAYGYGVEFMPMRFAGIIPAVTSGKCDFGIGAITITDERKESVLFSYPNVRTGNVFSVKKVIDVQKDDKNTEPPFFDELKASFERTFIREDRYKLFIEGIINTMIITVLSILFGIILGFTVFMLCRTGNIFANIMTKFSVWLIKGTPIVVLLMIFYYIIFGSVDINGIWVAVIAFSMTFGTSVYRMLTFGTGALDKGQTEAAYALGYTDLQTFFTIILPQAALHFMPSFREEVTTLIKSTAVVGYIAVQDLTKMGDIVRSRTYEAFFPLIAVAVIYFILAGLLNVIVLRIHWKITPSKRKPEDILKGINLKGEKNHD